jgi:coenzyme F420-0:L-glutamate ligase/coenzyme F420-1:gamma-L-glutamate ligase
VSEGALVVIPVRGIGEVRQGDSVAESIAAAVALEAGDVVVVTQKIVSKAEGRLVPFDGSMEQRRAIVESESVRVLRRRGDLIVAETRHGFICANAGVDVSNVEEGWAVLLPADPDRSARRVRDGIRKACGVEVGVVISDTFGRPWRRGVTDVAIGVAGVAAVLDLRGEPDALGRTLVTTEICVADEIAAAADLVMGKASGIPAAVVRGVDAAWLRDASVRAEIVRSPNDDLFR